MKVPTITSKGGVRCNITYHKWFRARALPTWSSTGERAPTHATTCGPKRGAPSSILTHPPAALPGRRLEMAERVRKSSLEEAEHEYREKLKNPPLWMPPLSDDVIERCVDEVKLNPR